MVATFEQGAFDEKTAADFLMMSPASISRLVRQGKIPSVKINGSRRFPKAALLDWLAHNVNGGDDDSMEPSGN